MLKPTSTERGQDVDMMAQPPAGISLTQDNSKFPWGNPPKESDSNKILSKAIDSLEQPKIKNSFLKLLLAGLSIESLVEGWVYSGFESGEFSLDAGLLVKSPLALYMASVAEEEGIPYRIFENEDAFDQGEIDDVSVLKLMKKNNPNMFNFLNEKLNETIRMSRSENIEDLEPQTFLMSDNPNKAKEQL